MSKVEPPFLVQLRGVDGKATPPLKALLENPSCFPYTTGAGAFWDFTLAPTPNND